MPFQKAAMPTAQPNWQPAARLARGRRCARTLPMVVGTGVMVGYTTASSPGVVLAVVPASTPAPPAAAAALSGEGAFRAASRAIRANWGPAMMATTATYANGGPKNATGMSQPGPLF